MLSQCVCENRDVWLAAWGLCGRVLIRFTTAWLLPLFCNHIVQQQQLSALPPARGWSICGVPPSHGPYGHEDPLVHACVLVQSSTLACDRFMQALNLACSVNGISADVDCSRHSVVLLI